MELGEFKQIFWWEWAHRFLARSVGVVFALPLLFLWLSGRVERGLGPRLLGLLALGGLQGAVGWWMVASGLTERVDVSQYRLATHLTLACVIYTAILVVARSLVPQNHAPADRTTQRFAGLMVFLVLCQIYLGGLVAGLDAGMSYNTWPLMDGAIVPDSLLVIEPAWRNFFENPKMVQFVHRMGAYTVLAFAVWHMLSTRRRQPKTVHAKRAMGLLHILLLQAVVGIATLLSQVHLHTALLHQFLAVMALTYATIHWRGTKAPLPVPAGATAAAT